MGEKNGVSSDGARSALSPEPRRSSRQDEKNRASGGMSCEEIEKAWSDGGGWGAA